MKKNPVLKKSRKYEVVIADILSQINAAGLVGGDRLLPVRELSSIYAINERTVLKALRELVERGVLENRPRDGYFVSKDNNLSIEESVADSEKSLIETPAVDNFSHLLIPLPRKKTLRVYISDSHHLQLQKWDKVFADFRELHPETELKVFTGNDGHIESLDAKHKIDVIHCPSSTLNSLQTNGMEFIPLDNLNTVGMNSHDLLDIVQDFVLKDKGLSGVPFGLGLYFLYVNQDLLKRVSEFISFPEKPDDLFFPLECRTDLQQAGVFPADFKLFQLLLFNGSISLRKSGSERMQINYERIITTLQKIVTTDIRLMENWNTQATTLFRQGRYPFLFHLGFVAGLFHQEFNFNWQAYPVPDNLIAGQRSDLIELVINKNTGSLYECLDLVKYLSSLKVQQQLAGPYGRLPVLKKAVFNDKFFSEYLIPEKTVCEALDKNSISFSFSVEEFNFENEVNNCGIKLQRGQLKLRETADRIRFIHEHYFQQNKILATGT